MLFNALREPCRFYPWRSLARSATSMLLVLTGLLGVSQPTSAADGKFVNLSTRALVESGEEVMIGGFIIEGGARQVLIQAVGPELVEEGISNALADPVLTVIQTSEGEPPRVELDPPIERMFNDNWQDSQGQLITDLWGGSPNLTVGSLSSAVVLTLEPGGYTAKVEGKDRTAGVAIVEVYRIDSAETEGEFVNISTRALVETGEEVMIGGFIIEGGARQVLIQARGPELVDDGISNVLADPVLTVIQTSEGEPPRTELDPPIERMVNDNWQDSQGQLVRRIWGDFLNLRDDSASSALVIPLEPGGYTAMIEGKNGTAGVAIGEVYGIDSAGAGSPDLVALTALYNATDGANWSKRTNWLSWLSDTPLDQWYGVVVDGEGRVIELDLSENGLAGPIPPELGRLTNLEELDLSGNNLWGPIPAELGNLANLQTLRLSNSQLVGLIPNELGRLTKLKELDLSGNSHLDGPIPPELGNLANLEKLILSGTRGPIPTELGQLTKLKELELSWNVTRGPIPPELGNLANLEKLVLYHAFLTGPIPPELGRLNKLKELELSANQLSGPIPAELGNLASLESLKLSNNYLSGLIPPELGRLTKLEEFELSNNHQLSGTIPAELGNLANLERLSLNENHQLGGPIPAELGRLARLEELELTGNQLTGPIPPELGQLINLEVLLLGYNQLTGPIPTELGNLAVLERMFLNHNHLTGPIPVELGNLINLEDLALSENLLTGPIPAELSNLANLKQVFLHDNLLIGHLPATLPGLSLDLFWWNNNAGVCAPDSPAFRAWLDGIGNHQPGSYCVTPREALMALYNATDGSNWTRSDNWGTSTPLNDWYGLVVDGNGRVIELDLSENLLSGPIPAKLSNLINLERLSLSGNQLSGPIPIELGNLANLKRVFLHDNLLIGHLPATLPGLSLDSFWWNNNAGICAPDSPAFRAWLDGIENHQPGSYCVTPREALMALYNATDGANWTRSDNWGTSAPLNDWDGVEANDRDQVTFIEFLDNKLSGPIPPELGDLTNLQGLIIRANQLNGPIPAELGNLPYLEILFLSGNQLNGPIPAELGRLTNLEVLLLDDNQLSGSIPAELGQLTNLEDLALSENQLSGPIPNSFLQLQQLNRFKVDVDNCVPATAPFTAWLEGIPDPDLGATLCK